MATIEDYVARIEGTCGEEKDVIVIFKYDKRDEVLAKILNRAKLEKSISQIIFELTFKNISFRVYGSGKAIFRSVKDKDELKNILSELLL
jgi:ArsR family metal-binding transcriptional regulator